MFDKARRMFAAAMPVASRPGAVVTPERTPAVYVHAAAVEPRGGGDAGGAEGRDGGLGRGDSVERYMILGRVGHGGSGMLFTAHDTELDRKVMLRMLTCSGDGRGQLLREAQALARLSHPAIVAVLDVGTAGDQVWWTMEYVEGVTLAVWLAQPRRWREVLDVFVRAGEGLAAAHAAGLVHREFKAESVLVAVDGRVRVTDYGLVRTDSGSSGSTWSDGPVSSSALRAGLVAAAARNGTTAILAPEQWLGGVTDARTDQFAFCVALWTALHGAAPYAGENQAMLIQRVVTGRRRAPPGEARVPSWLRKIVERGLAPAPRKRWAGMAELLMALSGGAGRRARRLGLVGVVVGLAVVAAIAAGRRWEHAAQVDACALRGGSIAEVWNDETRAQTRAALVATAVPYAATTSDRLAARLGEFTAAWTAARTQACMHTEVEATWDRELATRADECLGEARWALEDLVAALATADAGVVTRAVTAAAGLPMPGACLDEAWLARRPRPPQDAAARAEAAAVQRALEQARTLLALGHYAEGVVRARQLSARADALGWVPLSARARVLAGELSERAGDRQAAERLLEDGFFLASEAGEDALAVEAAALLTYTVGDRLARPADGLRWGRLGLSLLPRLGPSARAVEVELYDHFGNVEQLRGDYTAATKHYEQALAGAEALYGPSHPTVAVVLNNLAAVHYVRGDYDEAGALYERALQIYEAVLGPDHPHMAAFANNLGSVHFSRGDLDQAERLFTRALAIRERVLGRDHTDVAMPLANLAGVYLRRGRDGEAEAALERALAIYERAFGPDHVEVAATLDSLGELFMRSGALDEAWQAHTRALAIREKILGSDHLDTADSLTSVADIHRAHGDAAAAEPLYRRALAIDEQILAADHAEIAVVRRGLAESLLAQSRAAEAVTVLAPVMTPRPHEQPLRLAAARFTLAQALWASDGDRTQARQLAEAAAADYRRASPPEPTAVASIDAWLASHPQP